MNLAPKTHIQNIEIAVHQFQFLPYGCILVDLLHIVPKKIRHIFHKETRLVRSLHHGKLRPGIQGIKQKMGIDLGLKIF